MRRDRLRNQQKSAALRTLSCPLDDPLSLNPNSIGSGSALRQGSLADKVQVARKAVLARNACNARKESETLDSLRTWEAGQGAADIQKVCDSFPTFSKLDMSVQPRPMASCVGIDVTLCEEEVLGQMLTYIEKHKRSSNLLKAVDALTDVYARPIQISDCCACPKAATLSRCMTFGACTCPGSPSYPCWLFRNVLYQKLRDVFPAATPSKRALLVDGKVVLRFLTDSGSDGSSSSSSVAQCSTDIFCHIGLMYLKPYRPTFQSVLLSEVPLGEPPSSLDRAYIKAYVVVSTFGWSERVHYYGCNAV